MFSGLTSFITVFDGIVISLKQLIKISLGSTTRLCDHSLLLLKLLPQTRVTPSVSQLVEHLKKSHRDINTHFVYKGKRITNTTKNHCNATKTFAVSHLGSCGIGHTAGFTFIRVINRLKADFRALECDQFGQICN